MERGHDDHRHGPDLLRHAKPFQARGDERRGRVRDVHGDPAEVGAERDSEEPALGAGRTVRPSPAHVNRDERHEQDRHRIIDSPTSFQVPQQQPGDVRERTTPRRASLPGRALRCRPVGREEAAAWYTTNSSRAGRAPPDAEGEPRGTNSSGFFPVGERPVSHPNRPTVVASVFTTIIATKATMFATCRSFVLVFMAPSILPGSRAGHRLGSPLYDRPRFVLSNVDNPMATKQRIPGRGQPAAAPHHPLPVLAPGDLPPRAGLQCLDALDKLKHLTLTQEEFKGSLFSRGSTSASTRRTGRPSRSRTRHRHERAGARRKSRDHRALGHREFLPPWPPTRRGREPHRAVRRGASTPPSWWPTGSSVSRRVGEEKAWRWTSDGKGEFEIAEASGGSGTR